MDNIGIRIDPEFQEQIPPLTEEEYSQLLENILADGEVYEPITIWNGTIVDGHNRWRIISAHPQLKYHLREIEFPDKWAAFDWMIKKQLGRRNLTGEQRMLLIGRMYEGRKKSVGEHKGNQHSNLEFGQNDQIPNSANSTAKQMASELGIGEKTVRRAEKYAKGIDAIRSVSDKAAETILKGNSGIKRSEVIDFPDLKPKEQEKIAAAIAKGKKDDTPKMQPVSKLPHKHISADAEIDRINAEARDLERTREYSLDDMLEEMQAISNSHTSQLRRVLKIRNSLMATSDAREVILAFLCDSINALEQLKVLVKPTTE